MKYSLSITFILTVIIVGCIESTPEITTTTFTTTTYKTTTSTTYRPTTTQTTTTTFRRITLLTTVTITTTTIFIDKCNNGLLDPGEVYIDCEGTCYDCKIMSLGESFVRYPLVPYSFRYNGTEKVRGICKKGAGWPTRASYFGGYCYEDVYNIVIKTPDGLTDYRALALNDTGYIDGLKFKLLEKEHGGVKVYVKRDPDVKTIPSDAQPLSVCSNCAKTELCTRNWNNYNLDLVERAGDGAKFNIILPSGRKILGIWIYTYKTTRIDGIELGLLHPYDEGGYVVLYARLL